MSLSGDKGVAQFKKSVKMGHPILHSKVPLFHTNALTAVLYFESIQTLPRTCSKALLWSLINEEVLQGEGFRQDVVSNVAATDAEKEKRSYYMSILSMKNMIT